MRLFTLTALSVVATSVAGCTQSTVPSPDLVTAETSAVPNSNVLTLTIFKTIYDQNDETDGTKSKIFVDPTPDIIREQFGALDWENPLHRNNIHLHKGVVNTPDHIYLTIGGTLKPRNADEHFEATWLEMPEGQTVSKQSNGPITSEEHALELLLSFLAQDDKYRTAVQWSE